MFPGEKEIVESAKERKFNQAVRAVENTNKRPQTRSKGDHKGQKFLQNNVEYIIKNYPYHWFFIFSLENEEQW